MVFPFLSCILSSSIIFFMSSGCRIEAIQLPISKNSSLVYPKKSYNPSFASIMESFESNRQRKTAPGILLYMCRISSCVFFWAVMSIHTDIMPGFPLSVIIVRLKSWTHIYEPSFFFMRYSTSYSLFSLSCLSISLFIDFLSSGCMQLVINPFISAIKSPSLSYPK